MEEDTWLRRDLSGRSPRPPGPGRGVGPLPGPLPEALPGGAEDAGDGAAAGRAGRAAQRGAPAGQPGPPGGRARDARARRAGGAVMATRGRAGAPPGAVPRAYEG